MRLIISLLIALFLQAPATLGSVTTKGCGDALWKHVYNPHRLSIRRDCVTVTGVIVDASDGRSPDGLVHALDGDAKGWLKVDPEFVQLLDAGNSTLQSGNLPFEVVCRFQVEQESAKPACAGFKDEMTIPPVGTHVAMTGSLVRDTQPSGINWNEIHPVAAIRIR